MRIPTGEVAVRWTEIEGCYSFISLILLQLIFVTNDFFFRFENRAVLELASNGSRSNPHLASLFDRSLEVARPRENQIGSSAFLFPSRENDLITSHSFDFTVEAAVHPLNCMCEIKLGKLYEASGSFY